MPGAHKWQFKSRLREHAFGWHGSKPAIARLQEAASEIKSIARTDTVAAAEGIIALAERLWPALQEIDTSSGALGNTVNHALEELLPILIAAPADPTTRQRWLERLHRAVQNDGIQYLWLIEDRWGEVAVYPELMNAYADELLPLLRRVWTEEPPGDHIVGTTICLSSLLEVGRYGELLALLGDARRKSWGWHRFGAEALARQGLWDAAIAYAEGCRDTRLTQYDDHRIDRFCEQILIRTGQVDQAYRQYGLRTARGQTYLATYQDTVRRYPDVNRRQILLDLIETRGDHGKWFAAAKAAGFLDIAVGCARSLDAEPATLGRAARDFSHKEPGFALEVGLLALQHLLDGRGFEPDPALVRQTAEHCLLAASQIGRHDWARQHMEHLAARPLLAGQGTMQRVLAGWLCRADPIVSVVNNTGRANRNGRRRGLVSGRG